MKGSLNVMKDIKKEFNKLSKQGKFNFHCYIISVIITITLLFMGLTILSLRDTVTKQSYEIEKLEQKMNRLENIQNSLIVHIHKVGG